MSLKIVLVLLYSVAYALPASAQLIYSVDEYVKHGYVSLDLEKNMDESARDYNSTFIEKDKKASSYELLGLCFLAMAKEQKLSYGEVNKFLFTRKYPQCAVFDSFK